MSLEQHASDLLGEIASTQQAFAAEAAETLARVSQALVDAFTGGNRFYVFGNGGSAADAEHFAGELQGRFLIDRGALPAVALTGNAALMTAIGNDYSYDRVFERQVQAVVREGDVVLGMSTSGNSGNVLTALRSAKEQGAITIGFTGSGGGDLPALCDICLRAPSDHTPRIQECHHAAMHVICELVEQALFGDRGE
jgi:D-sedoheptulose 7-phosphate isomerase